jgi:hypothetical protein
MGRAVISDYTVNDRFVRAAKCPSTSVSGSTDVRSTEMPGGTSRAVGTGAGVNVVQSPVVEGNWQPLVRMAMATTLRTARRIM